MELTPKQQTIEAIHRAERILVVTHKQPDGDGIGSMLALKLTLEKLGKKITVACPSPAPAVLEFLPDFSTIQPSLPASKDIVLSINTKQFMIEKLGYRQDQIEKKLHIIITPKEGTISQEDIEVSPAKQSFDIVVVLDTPDIERLGHIYDDNPKLFYEVPVINIDHHPSNEQFGTINWIDMVATSTAEILVALIESLSSKMSSAVSQESTNPLDEQIATCLLTGIIADTSSFQNINTTPKSLTVAAQLVAAGARQQEIVYHLYKTKSLSTLKLWGSVLSKVTDESAERFIWTIAAIEDFRKAGAQATELDGLIDELLKTTRDRDFVIVFSQRGNQLHGSIRAINQTIDVSPLAQRLGGGGHPQAAAFDALIKDNFSRSVHQVIDQIKDWVKSKRFTTDAL